MVNEERSGYWNKMCVFSKLRPILCRKSFQQGIGAVFVFVDVGFCVTGAIFTAVAYGDAKKEDVVSSFPYSGPILLVVSVFCMVGGYVLNHIDVFTYLWKRFKRTENPYVDQERDYDMLQFDCVGAICFKLVVCYHKRRYRVNRECVTCKSLSADGRLSATDSEIKASNGNSVVDLEAADKTDSTSNVPSSSSSSCLSRIVPSRQCKVYPA